MIPFDSVSLQITCFQKNLFKWLANIHSPYTANYYLYYLMLEHVS